MQDVSHNGYSKAFKAPFVVANGVHIEHSLGGVCMAAIAGVDDGHVRGSVARDVMRCPESAWRTTNMSLAMASRLRSISIKDSPLLVAERAISMLRTSAERRLAASSKVERVRVLGSKNKLTTVLPRNKGTFLISLPPTSTKDAAVSRICSRTGFGKPRKAIKLRSWPPLVSCMLVWLSVMVRLVGVDNVCGKRGRAMYFNP